MAAYCQGRCAGHRPLALVVVAELVLHAELLDLLGGSHAADPDATHRDLVVADQQVIFGGAGEVLTIRHETISPEAYVQGIKLAIAHATSSQGTTVGLDGVLGLGDLVGRA